MSGATAAQRRQLREAAGKILKGEGTVADTSRHESGERQRKRPRAETRPPLHQQSRAAFESQQSFTPAAFDQRAPPTADFYGSSGPGYQVRWFSVHLSFTSHDVFWFLGLLPAGPASRRLLGARCAGSTAHVQRVRRDVGPAVVAAQQLPTFSTGLWVCFFHLWLFRGFSSGVLLQTLHWLLPAAPLGPGFRAAVDVAVAGATCARACSLAFATATGRNVPQPGVFVSAQASSVSLPSSRPSSSGPPSPRWRGAATGT